MSTTTQNATSVTFPTPGTYTVDPVHSEVGLVARHLIGSKVRGKFTEFEAQLVIADPPEQSTVAAQVKAASIDTGNDMRDDHLRSNDFLSMEEFPTLTLQSTGLRRLTDTEWKLDADLTIRGVTKAVVFDLEYHGTGPNMQGGEAAAFSASTEIDRRDFGVSFNAALDNGGLVVSNKVKIEIEIEAHLDA